MKCPECDYPNPVFEYLKKDLNILMHTKVCEEHRRTHPNCVGCVSQDRCHEYLSRVNDYIKSVAEARRIDLSAPFTNR